MVDISAIAGLMSSMNAVANITKAMKDVHDANVIQTKVFELTREIMSAQACAIQAQMAQTELLERVRQLEEEKVKLEAWNTEKQRYELKSLAPGIVALALKPAMSNGEPMHYICANCCAAGKKSYLQQHISGPYYDEFRCRGCGDEIPINKGTPPNSYIQPTDF